jgi:hypothetical protein
MAQHEKSSAFHDLWASDQCREFDQQPATVFELNTETDSRGGFKVEARGNGRSARNAGCLKWLLWCPIKGTNVVALQIELLKKEDIGVNEASASRVFAGRSTVR